MKKELDELSKIAAAFSAPDMVQGSGGNISAKIDKGTMLIKASGFRFAELSPERGFVALSYPMLKERYASIVEPERKDGERAEGEFLLSARISGEKGRPSMEAGFHAFLGKYVLHTHSVYANVINCSLGGKELSEEICAKLGFSSVFLPYFHPGAELAIAVGRLTGQGKNIPEIIFLKNHGIVVSADSAERILSLHEELNIGIKKYLKLEDYVPYGGAVMSAKDYEAIAGEMLFPDQAVFGRGDGSESDSGRELLAARGYILFSTRKLGIRPSFLPAEAAAYLRNMDAEKYRKKLSDEK